MNILLFCESPLLKKQDGIHAKDSWIKFPLFFSQYCDSLTIICTESKVSQVKQDEYSKINVYKAKLIFISDYNSFSGFYKNYLFENKKWKKTIESQIKRNDIIWIRLPSPMLDLIFNSRYISSKKIVPFLGGDIKEQSDKLIKSKGLKKFFYEWYIDRYIKKEKFYYRSADLIYYYSESLKDIHKRIFFSIVIFIISYFFIFYILF